MQGKVAIITGGAQGIGRVISQRLLEKGCSVAIWEQDEKALREIQKEFEKLGHVLALPCDIAQPKAIEKALEQTVEAFGRIDILVNNAAIFENKPLEDWSFEDWAQGINVNLSGPFWSSRVCAPYLKASKGVIINLCSTRAFQSDPDTFAYSASKGGIFALTHALAISLGPDIRVNCISPGWIDVTAYQKSSDQKPAKLSKADHEQHPAGRVGNPDDIANLVIFLSDPANSFITGQNFTVDGGMSRKMIYV
ncbi:oxidoreductase [Siphonobacter sp. SORGH_AS_0500]|uniref:glucose 1-dehydrogenase n=1 Tax=Siphonobacter sp. SORGH_AS_0500 TaxID=1864824 RepID=UPI000CADBA87|nr:glucose 1-dehydrogenase [Siphonobacter sp. SORGH_AS_0500]PKK36006.1 oxidoreductase [Siphonobacter sp. SORGH_AS_0500]